MKILASADIHGNHGFYHLILDAAKNSEAQAIILAGDLLGYPPGFDSVEDAQRADAKDILDMLETSSVPVFSIMGNDDLVEFGPGKGRVRSIHGTRIDLGQYNFVGYQFSLPFMGGIFEKTEEAIGRELDEMVPLANDHTVFVTHGPARGFLDRTMLGTHAGSTSVMGFIEKTGVRAHVHGHIHSGFGRHGRHFNVAATPIARAMLIDIERMTHRVIELSAGGG